MNAQRQARPNQLKVIDNADELLDPVPDTYDAAEAFLREKCKTTLTWKEDIDVLRVTVTAETPDADKRTFSQDVELSLNDRNQRQAAIVNVAIQAHAFRRRMTTGEGLADA